ncbi:hypothetical protein BDV34DRAFT_221633 [Aspergillus parasiticus]|uniref:VOC domain-containing protein n=1 Tax=Aspergillus parasiticus TaxID=5067 RepID=A0A5N6DXA7_ASPPA|nr:hypothetical protein BDV34DRAFT_221633 [Aspergillus parasiticus]
MTESAPKLNRGMTLADTVAMGINQEPQASWLAKRRINLDSRIKLTRLSHMRYQHSDLDAIHQFMVDFGLQVAHRTDDEVWYKGYGPDQYVYYAKKGPRKFLGGVFQAATWDDFERASKLPSAEPIQQLKDAPGGGFLVTVTDPEGFPVNVIYGQQPVADKPTYSPEKVILNFPEEKPRVRQFNRFEPGPAAVYKLGHFGLTTQKFEEQLEFYTSNFNIVPTDFVYVEAEGHRVPVTTFMHLKKRFYFDLAGFPFPDLIQGYLRIGDASRLLYGSDYPYTPGALVENLGKVMDENIPELFKQETVASIYSCNAKQLFRF